MTLERVRVVFVTTVFEGVDTGPATYAQYLWKAFRDEPGIEFHVVAPRFVEQHPRLHAVGEGGGSLALYRRVQEKGGSVAVALGRDTIIHGNSTHSMGRLVRYDGPLLVQVNDYETATFPRHVARIFEQHGARRTLSFAWRYREERRVLRHASLAICNSQFTADAIKHAYSLEESRQRVIHKAVSTESFRRPVGQPPDPIAGMPRGTRLVFVGSDWQRKGLDVLLEAIARIAPQFPDTVLSVIGPDRHDPALLALLRKSGLANRVVLHGQASREAVANCLWHSDVFVLPSRREALGVAVLEAMAAGLPVIATTAGGIPEIVRPGTDGLLVEPDDARQLADALTQMLEDPALRNAMSVEAARRAEDFSVARMIEALRETYMSFGEAGSGPKRHDQSRRSSKRPAGSGL